jgi:hypothetical protein
MDDARIRAWFDQYLETIASLGRGESDNVRALMEYYGVPLVVTTDDATQVLTSADEVMSFAGQQITGMRATGYDHTEASDAEVTTLNATSALYRVALERQRADGSEIGRLGVTYLITDGSAGLRASALAIHTP